MTERSCYFRIPLWNTEFCFSYSEQNTRLGFAVDGYPDGTTQILVGKLRARMSPGADSEGTTDLIFR
jgi:hypothetical protein